MPSTDHGKGLIFAYVFREGSEDIVGVNVILLQPAAVSATSMSWRNAHPRAEAYDPNKLILR